jgi:hypothetical protein
MGFERQHHPLAPRDVFVRRMAWMALLALATLVIALAVGITGYRLLAGMAWVDALLNASMILGGMGPVGELRTDAAKIFASLYALFAGVVFILSIGILVAPLVHRGLHRFHLDDRDLPTGSKKDR